MRVGSEVWDDGNIASSDGCKPPGSDGETSNNLDFEAPSLNTIVKIMK